jgi:predicted RNase H-like HicB family nuclease
MTNKHVCLPEASSSYGDLKLESMREKTLIGNWSVFSPQELHFYEQGKTAEELNIDTVNETWIDNFIYNTEKKEKFNRILNQFKYSVLPPFGNALTKRLLKLYQIAIDEEPDSVGMSIDSFYNFYKFMNLSNLRIYPSISLTTDNNIYASWRKDTGHVFSVHFLPSGDTQFVIFKPDERYPTKKTRISGITTTDNLMKTVESNIRDWLLV